MNILDLPDEILLKITLNIESPNAFFSTHKQINNIKKYISADMVKCYILILKNTKLIYPNFVYLYDDGYNKFKLFKYCSLFFLIYHNI